MGCHDDLSIRLHVPEAKAAPESFELRGCEDARCNGVYVAKGPPVNGRRAYENQSDPNRDVWICYDDKYKNWTVQRTERKGTAKGWCCTRSGPHAAPWDGEATWKEPVDDEWQANPAIAVSGVLWKAHTMAHTMARTYMQS